MEFVEPDLGNRVGIRRSDEGPGDGGPGCRAASGADAVPDDVGIGMGFLELGRPDEGQARALRYVSVNELGGVGVGEAEARAEDFD